MKIMFARAHPLCHDANASTKSPTHLDIVMGFSTSDISEFETQSVPSRIFLDNILYALSSDTAHSLV